MSQKFASLHGSKLPSDKTFGFVFSGIFLIFAGWAYFKNSSFAWTIVFLVITCLFLACALLCSAVLRPLNKVWYQLGLIMARFVSPIVLGILFFIVITPVAICMRLTGRDALLLKRRNVDSYWISRKPPGPEPESFKEQF